MKRIAVILLAAALLTSCALAAPAEETPQGAQDGAAGTVPVPAAVIMAKTCGKVL